MDIGSWKHSPGVSHEINMTPLIDVSLVLVVILLLTTPLAIESSIGVRNESKRVEDTQEKKRDKGIELYVFSEDSVRVNRRVVARADLGPTIQPLIEQSVDHGVVVACGRRVSHGAFVNVLDQAKIAGAKEISVFER